MFYVILNIHSKILNRIRNIWKIQINLERKLYIVIYLPNIKNNKYIYFEKYSVLEFKIKYIS